MARDRPKKVRDSDPSGASSDQGLFITSLPMPTFMVLAILLIPYLVSSYNGPILDCDEAFNYWEPLHYLVHHHGLQTWEYSPEYSIRSWTYILLHALPVKVIGLFSSSKSTQFFGLRGILVGGAALANTSLYTAIAHTLSARVANWFLLIAATSPGFFFASNAFLPSSFAMITSSLGLASFLNSRTSAGLLYFGIGAMLGWPFAGALIIPFVVHDLTRAFGGRFMAIAKEYTVGITVCLVVLFSQVLLDSLFYRKFVVVPWLIVMYNVFGGDDRGPDIFGTDPWHFYIRNLLLNHHVYFMLAVVAIPMVFVHRVLVSGQRVKTPLWTPMTPFYLWVAIFTLQPHKEERFMFPAYPFLAMNAAIAFEIVLSWWQFLRFPNWLTSCLVAGLAMGTTALSMLRITGALSAYSAPLKLSAALNEMQLDANSTVCFGKDWYRFHSSFLLPDGARPKFIKSEFDGLLPGEFAEDQDLWFPGTWTIPKGMNDRNQEDKGKYTDLSKCSFLIDSTFPSTTVSRLEPDFVKDHGFEIVQCEAFLDAASTGILGRTIWVPDSKRVWGKHCLLLNRSHNGGRLPLKAFNRRRVSKDRGQ